MAMSLVLTNIYGQIVHENRGGVERFYVPDPLGNTAALVDTTGAVKDSWTYWPYGEVQNHTGSSTTAFTFLGILGYFTDAVGRIYVRSRIERPDLARWLTVDPLWTRGSNGPYAYAASRPSIYVDPAGERPHRPGHRQKPWDTAPCRRAYAAALSVLKKCFNDQDAQLLAAIMQCIAYGESGCDPRNASAAVNETAYGLYQLGKTEIGRCFDSGCPDYSAARTQIGDNTRAAVNEILWLMDMFGADGTIESVLCRYWGVLDCPGHHRREGGQTAACLHAKGIDPTRTPMPTPKAGCDPCA